MIGYDGEYRLCLTGYDCVHRLCMTGYEDVFTRYVWQVTRMCVCYV